jgi:hypothetical protein
MPLIRRDKEAGGWEQDYKRYIDHEAGVRSRTHVKGPEKQWEWFQSGLAYARTGTLMLGLKHGNAIRFHYD